MNCERCDARIEPRHRSQPTRISADLARGWPSFCDNCLRAHAWQPGSHAALDRLARGRIAIDEATRLAEVAPSPFGDGTWHQPERISYEFAIPERP